MKYMILVKATQDTEAGRMPPESLIAEMGAYHEELAKAGVLVDGSGLKPSSRGWRIHHPHSGTVGNLAIPDHAHDRPRYSLCQSAERFFMYGQFIMRHADFTEFRHECAAR